MNFYIENYIAGEEPHYRNGNDISLLEMLFNAYTDFNGFENDIIRRDFAELYAAMNGKDLNEVDSVIDSVCTLCQEYQKVAFKEGIRVGVKILAELFDQQADTQ